MDTLPLPSPSSSATPLSPSLTAQIPSPPPSRPPAADSIRPAPSEHLAQPKPAELSPAAALQAPATLPRAAGSGCHYAIPVNKQVISRWANSPNCAIQERKERHFVQQQLLALPPHGSQVVLQDLRYLTSLPEIPYLTRLELHNCPRLQQLPMRLFVAEDIHISDCPALVTLGKDLHVCGSLKVESCPRILTLPEQLYVGQSTLLSNCLNLVHIGEGCRFLDHVKLVNCSLAQSIAPEVLFEGNLNIITCTQLKQLPPALRCGNDLYLDNCPNLQTIGEDISIHRDLSIIQCPKLVALPSKLQLGRSLHLEEVGIQELPSCLSTINGALNMYHCHALRQLPPSLTIQGHGRISHAPLLQKLPETLWLGSSLDLSHCPNLAQLPEQLYCSKSLNLSHCKNLRYVPISLQTNAAAHSDEQLVIHMEGVTLAANNYWQWADWLAKQDPHHCPIVLRLSDLGRKQLNFPPLHHFWQQLTAQSSANWTNNYPNIEQQQLLYRYLRQLCTTAEYRDSKTKSRFQKRIQALGPMLHDLDYGAIALGIMDTYLSSCVDGLIRSLDQIELGYLIHQATKQPQRQTALRQLGLRLFKLAKVRQYALQHAARLRQKKMLFIDDTEFCLYYEIRLAKALHLPIQTTAMLYAAEIQPKEIAQVKSMVLADCRDSEQVEAFFDTWEPWQKHMRLQASKECKYEQLPTAAKLPPMADNCCPFTQELIMQLKQPVCIPNHQGYLWCDFPSLMQWWQSKGTNPITHQPIQLEQWRRAEPIS